MTDTTEAVARRCRICDKPLNPNAKYDLCRSHNMQRIGKAGVGPRALHRRYRRQQQEIEALRQKLSDVFGKVPTDG